MYILSLGKKGHGQGLVRGVIGDPDTTTLPRTTQNEPHLTWRAAPAIGARLKKHFVPNAGAVIIIVRIDHVLAKLWHGTPPAP